jgi:hypothetical protein
MDLDLEDLIFSLRMRTNWVKMGERDRCGEEKYG